MAKILYLPIPTTEARVMAQAWNDGRVAKQKLPFPIIECRYTGAMKAFKHAANRGDLRGVAAGDNLIILAHGLKPGAHIEDHTYPAVGVGMSRGAVAVQDGLATRWDGGELKNYSPTRLARHLDREGLTHQISIVTLFACSGAATMSSPTFSPFAQRFKAALVELGFANVKVFGYDGDLAAFYTLRRHNGQQAPHPNASFEHTMTADRYKGVWDAVLEDYVPSKCGKVEF